MTIFSSNSLQDTFQQRRRRILSSLRGISSKTSDRRYHSRRQYRKGEQARHRTERQNKRRFKSFISRENNGTPRRHPLSETQIDSKGERSQNPDVRRQIEAEQVLSRDLKIETDPTKLLENADESITNPPTQNVPQPYQRTMRDKDGNLRDTSNSGHQENNKNVPENLTLPMDRTKSMKVESTKLKTQEKKNASGIHEKPEDLQIKRYCN